MKLLVLFLSQLLCPVAWAQTSQEAQPSFQQAPTVPPDPSQPTQLPPSSPPATTLTVPGPNEVPIIVPAPAAVFPTAEPEPITFPVENPTNNQATAVPSELSKDRFLYDPTIGRDPFKIPLINVDKLTRAEPIVNEDSLEGAEIPDGVKVLAIIYDSRKPRALVEKISNKKPYLVFNKSRLGIGGGVVSEIREDEIVVVRSIETEGQTAVENIILRLNDKKKKEERK
ncbi:MAG: hypothetical protein AABY64_13980 [Bdellovibrionota bacterium]